MTAVDVQADALATIRAQLAACRGCGAAFAEDYDAEHRPDCPLEPSPLLCDSCDAIRLPSERRPVWRYDPNAHTYRCPNHQKGTNP